MNTVQGHGLLRSTGRVLLDGLLVVVPIGAIILLVLGIVKRLQEAADPLAGSYVHPAIAAVVMLVLLCLLIGIFMRSATGHRMYELLERLLFEKVPGYRLVKAFTGDGPEQATRVNPQDSIDPVTNPNIVGKRNVICRQA
jgi:hypothetical protein